MNEERLLRRVTEKVQGALNRSSPSSLLGLARRGSAQGRRLL